MTTNDEEIFSRYAYREAKRKRFGQKASPELETKRRNDARYNSRRNLCDKCFTVKALKTGKCNCDDN